MRIPNTLNRNLDKNTLLSLNKDNKSIDLHKMALAKMNNARVDPSAKHDFIEDRIRVKNLDNMDDLYSKLNELEKNGALDIWIKKFGKHQYMGQQEPKTLKESGKLFGEIVEGKLTLNVDAILQEMDGAAAAGFTSVGSGPAATMGGMPAKNRVITDKYPDPMLAHSGEKTHQDTKLGGK